MRFGAQILAAVKHSFKALLTEVQRIIGLDLVVKGPDAQLLVNRSLAGVVVLAAVVFCFAPGDVDMKRTIANALFVAATWLWHGKRDPFEL